MYISGSFILSFLIIYAIMMFVGRERKYDGHPDTW